MDPTNTAGEFFHRVVDCQWACPAHTDVPEYIRLIALGRFDDAIGVLEAMRAGGELSPALEAMRCRELARAWDHKGQPDYAADYRDRARLVAR